MDPRAQTADISAGPVRHAQRYCRGGGGGGGQLQSWPWYLHGLLALFTIAVNLWAFNIEYRNVETNAGIIQAVLEEVDRIREQQGLNSNAEALLQEQGEEHRRLV